MLVEQKLYKGNFNTLSKQKCWKFFLPCLIWWLLLYRLWKNLGWFYEQMI